jgi:hypothetical protein
MGYYKSRLKCGKCNEEWNTFFCSVDMSRGAFDCPKCKTKNQKDECGYNPIQKVADDWKMDNGEYLNKE